jgi:hypothetical protein
MSTPYLPRTRRPLRRRRALAELVGESTRARQIALGDDQRQQKLVGVLPARVDTLDLGLTIRTELTDQMLIFGERHLRDVLTQYSAQLPPGSDRIKRYSCIHHAPESPVPSRSAAGPDVDPILGGLISQYEAAA